MDIIKFVINELNKEPFNKKLNVISYDNLKGEQRIEIMFSIFKLIDNSFNLSLNEALEPDEIVGKIFKFLRILQYKPQTNNNDEFRENILIGDESTYTHIYYFLFKNLPLLQKRSYLAKFLVKLEVSPELETDNDITEAYKKYEELIETFKAVHSNYELLINNVNSIQEVQKDIKSMENEKEQINNKLDDVRRRENVNKNPELLNSVKRLHEEKEKTSKMLKQKNLIEEELSILKKKYYQLENESFNLNKILNEENDVESFFEKLTDEINSKAHLIENILPKEIDSLSNHIEVLRKLELDEQIDINLDEINGLIKKLSLEINKELENRLLKDDFIDEKLLSFKQNAKAINDKKLSMEKEYRNLENEYMELKNKLNKKSFDENGTKVLVGQELKSFINEVKEKSADLNDKKNLLKEIKTEIGILTRTQEILENKKKTLNEELVDLENKKGLLGYFSNEENLKIIDSLETNQEDLTESIINLNKEIDNLKNDLNSSIKQLKPLRIQQQSLQQNYDQVKLKYENISTGLETKIINLKDKIKELNQNVNQKQTQIFKIDCELEVLEAKKKWIEDNQVENSENKLIEKITNEISLQKKKFELIEQKNQLLKENDLEARKQFKCWSDLIKLMKVKQNCYYGHLNEKKNQNEKIKDYLALNN